MDTELFMECEEEELEPWQQVDDSVEEDDMDYMDNYGEPVEDSSSSPPASETPPPRTPAPATPVPAGSAALRFGSSSPVPLRFPTPSVITATSSTSSTLCLTTTSEPAASAPPLRAQAQPLILTQTAGGTFFLPAGPGTGAGQPILLTAQAFQVPTVMTPGAPLVLNLQPGQMVQPLTLIQSPPLGQLVRPAVVLSQNQSSSSSTLASMRLPTTLTIRTGAPGPVNLQVAPAGGGSLKLLGSAGLPSNGVGRALGPALSAVAAATDPPRVVMSVEDFYYGRFSGGVGLRKAPPPGLNTFTCSVCSFRAENNLRLMQHVLLHSELVADSREQQCCGSCYRQFSSQAQLRDHQDQVHGSTQSTCLCRICEWAFDDEPAFLNHMKSNHKPGEMPYVCQVCSFRSSFYSDVLQHFTTFHRETPFLLCVFCLKVTRSPSSYQQHLYRHQLRHAFHCSRCRLQFIFLKDKMQHKAENHRSFRRPPQLEGLPPGSKVTIRTYGRVKPVMSNSHFQPNRIKTEPKVPTQRNAAVPTKSHKSPSRRAPCGRSWSEDRLVCLECGTDASDLAAHYPTYVHCLLCPYSSCCSRAYAGHMIHHHLRGSRDKVLPVKKAPPPCGFSLRCSDCDFHPRSADHMAQHLLTNPEHDGAVCCSHNYVEPDIQMCHPAEQQPSEGPDQNRDSPEPSWTRADGWKPPDGGPPSPVLPFTHPCGPNHLLSKNSDAIDFFSLLFPPALLELITKETNAHARTGHHLGSCPPDWEPVTPHEVKGFIGLVVLMGVHNLPDPAHYWSSNHFDRSYAFHRSMSMKRFKQIGAHIRMGPMISHSHELAPSVDPLHVFRPMLSILGGAMWDVYRPNCCLTIDRALLPGLEEDGAQGGPTNQPQVWLLCDSKSGYCHRLFIQAGDQSGLDLGFSVVPELVKDLGNKNHQLFLANSLASIPLMQKLLDQNIYACSSFPRPHPVLPRQLWEQRDLQKPGDFLQRQCGPLLATRWKDVKEMGCLSTNAAAGQPDAVWRRSPTMAGALVAIDRPMAFRLLQENMRGVDICKQLLACNPLGGVPQDRHWRNLFWFLVNLSIVNAFIVLRESRKDNPPAWVQDGLFSQVNFRKRLGNQLARCAQGHLEASEEWGSRGGRSDTSEEPVQQRHKMAKISGFSKRCRNCNLKNLRHESVYGCVTCGASLCKTPGCFWEFHGLSPLNKGSTKLGFLKDRISGEINLYEEGDHVDDAMGPVEELDFSDDEKLDNLENDEETEVRTTNAAVEGPEPSETIRVAEPAAALPPAAERQGSLTVRQLRIILFALCEGLREASRVFSTDPQLIGSWLKEARKREDEDRFHAEGSERMVAWVLSMREQQLPVTESNLFNKASVLKKKKAFGDTFRISYDWAVGFMLRHRLGVRGAGRPAFLSCLCSPALELRVRSFREFTRRVSQVQQLTERCVAAMDELRVFMDFRLARDTSTCSEALGLSGTTPLLTAYLTVLADGALLPTLVLLTEQLPERVLPEFLLVEARPNAVTAEEALELWHAEVWLRRQPGKSMLVLDRHHGHLADAFVSALSASQSLPAVLPAGSSFCLQPLEVCLKPVLERFLLSRWSDFTSRDPPELREAQTLKLKQTVSQLLLDWLLEAVTRLHTLPDMWRTSFQLTGLLHASSQDEAGRTPEDTRTELLRTLTEVLMGPEAPETDIPELQELEDREDRMEVEESGDAMEDRGDDCVLEDRKKVTDGMDRSATNVKDRGTVEKDWVEQEEKMETLKGDPEEKRPEDRPGEDGTKKTDSPETGDQEETETLGDSADEEEGQEDRREASGERRETRIVIGEDVGDEWKVAVKTRNDGARAEDDES